MPLTDGQISMYGGFYIPVDWWFAVIPPVIALNSHWSLGSITIRFMDSHQSFQELVYWKTDREPQSICTYKVVKLSKHHMIYFLPIPLRCQCSLPSDNRSWLAGKSRADVSIQKLQLKKWIFHNGFRRISTPTSVVPPISWSTHMKQLVGGLNPSEKNMKVNWDYYSQYMGK